VKPAIVVVDHGSRRPEANAQLEALARHLRESAPDRVIHFAHMELAEPTLAQAIDACVEAGAAEIVVHPYFLGPGNHTTHDIPRMVEESAARHAGLRVRVSEPLGLHPKLVEVVLERVGEAERER